MLYHCDLCAVEIARMNFNDGMEPLRMRKHPLVNAHLCQQCEGKIDGDKVLIKAQERIVKLFSKRKCPANPAS